MKFKLFALGLPEDFVRIDRCGGWFRKRQLVSIDWSFFRSPQDVNIKTPCPTHIRKCHSSWLPVQLLLQFNPDCWVYDLYDFDRCCHERFGAHGNLSCWSGIFNRDFCCRDPSPDEFFHIDDDALWFRARQQIILNNYEGAKRAASLA